MTSDGLDELIARARALGASDTRVIPTGIIKVEDQFPELCKPPQCDGYNQSANCPPYEMTPAEFRQRLEDYHRALVFKIDCPMEILLDEDGRADVNRLVHDVASGVETLARSAGFEKAWGLAFGSCKRIFCSEHESCNVVSGGGPCRNPDRARNSMSGLGINFNRLNSALDWDPGRTAKESGLTDTAMTMVVGMVLLD